MCQRLCEWDHKPVIGKRFGMEGKDGESGDYWTPVPGTGMEIYCDVWSNIHYGYIGRVAGFSEKDLLGASHLNGVAGNPDAGDDIAVKIGFDLFDRSDQGSLRPVTAAMVHDLITQNYAAFVREEVMQVTS